MSTSIAKHHSHQHEGAPRMLRLGEVALLLRLHPNTVRAWADRGVLKAYRTGERGTRRFRQDEVMRLISAGL